MNAVSKLGILYNNELDRAKECAERIVARYGGHKRSLDESDKLDALQDSDMVLALGGDGTLLKAIQWLAPHKVPVLGINAGNLGFLMELRLEDAVEQLEPLLQGKHRIEERHLLAVSGADQEHLALNECWVHRGASPKVIDVRVSIDGAEFSRYRGDGLLAATATGSTGYALSLGGPLLDTQSSCFLIMPIAVHSSASQPLVADGAATLRMELVSAQTPAPLYIDGIEVGRLAPGDEVQVRTAPHTARLVRRNGAGQRWGDLARRLGRNDA